MSQYDYPWPFDAVFTVSENLFPVIAILYCRAPNFSTAINYNLYNKKISGSQGEEDHELGGENAT